jgi:hypothetical protein
MKMSLCRTVCFCLLILFVPANHAAATIPAPVADIVRQLQEWRNLSTGLMQECARTYGTNEAALANLKLSYIEASSIANSLIDQFQLETAAKVSMNPKRYAPHIDRAKNASDRLITEGKRLLAPPEGKTRGAPTGAGTTGAGAATGSTAGSGSAAAATSTAKPAGTTAPSTDALETTRQSVSLLSGVMDIVGKNKKAFSELASEQRKEVSKLLADQKWLPLDQALGRSKPAMLAPTPETKAKK